LTEFEGRGDEVHVLPLSFSEYFCFKQGDKSEAYDDYFLKKIIDNPVYMGKIAYGRRRTEKKTGTRNEMHVVEQSEFPVYEGIHEANLDVTDIHYDKKFQICRDD